MIKDRISDGHKCPILHSWQNCYCYLSNEAIYIPVHFVVCLILSSSFWPVKVTLFPCSPCHTLALCSRCQVSCILLLFLLSAIQSCPATWQTSTIRPVLWLLLFAELNGILFFFCWGNHQQHGRHLSQFLGSVVIIRKPFQTVGFVVTQTLAVNLLIHHPPTFHVNPEEERCTDIDRCRQWSLDSIQQSSLGRRAKHS